MKLLYTTYHRLINGTTKEKIRNHIVYENKKSHHKCFPSDKHLFQIQKHGDEQNCVRVVSWSPAALIPDGPYRVGSRFHPKKNMGISCNYPASLYPEMNQHGKI